MATTGDVLTAPLTVPGSSTNWENELAYTEAARYGYEAVSLTEWASGNTTKPEIAAGSVIEINGAMCKYPSQTTLTDDGSLADGWCYIKHVVSGATITPTLTNTWGTWDTAKQGYYDGSSNRYSLFAMYRSGAVTKIFTGKHMLPINTVYDDNDIGTIIDGDSDYFPAKKIKYRIYQTAGNGTAQLTIAHGISNLISSLRLIDIRVNFYQTSSPTQILGAESYYVDLGSFFTKYTADATNLILDFIQATNAIFTYRVVVAYV